jgi:hypothetical protein
MNELEMVFFHYAAEGTRPCGPTETFGIEFFASFGEGYVWHQGIYSPECNVGVDCSFDLEG